MALVISLNTRPEKHEDSYNFQQQNHVTEQSDTLPFEQLKCVGQKHGDALIGIFFFSVQTPNRCVGNVQIHLLCKRLFVNGLRSAIGEYA